MRPRKARLDVAEIVTDAAAGYLASKARGAHIEQVDRACWEQLVKQLLEADPRFVAGSGGTWELAEVRDWRVAAMTGEQAG